MRTLTLQKDVPPPPLSQQKDLGNMPSLNDVVDTIIKAKRIAVVCGAGISCAAGIPDFRSSSGLFKSLKSRYPKAGLTSGKDLFSASFFKSGEDASLFYTMIAELRQMSDDADPTPFHRLLKELDDRGKLMRVYTQNIDGLEEKVGLTYGLGEVQGPVLVTSRKRKRTTVEPSSVAGPPTPRSEETTTSRSDTAQSTDEATCSSRATPEAEPVQQLPTPAPSVTKSTTPSRSKASRAPRVTPLHGTMQYLTCTKCSYKEDLADHLDTLSQGEAVPCPSCTAEDVSRTILSERSRGVGVMKVGVVLYGEEHSEATRVGDISHRDLMGPRPDLLIVAGTSLKVPGTKRLVRELAKVTKPPTSKPDSIHCLYLNMEFPSPSREWSDVFDVWVRGDLQSVVRAFHDREEELLRQREERVAAIEDRKREAVRRKEESEARKEAAEAKRQARALAKTEREARKAEIESKKVKKSQAIAKSKAKKAKVALTIRPPKPKPPKIKPSWTYVPWTDPFLTMDVPKSATRLRATGKLDGMAMGWEISRPPAHPPAPSADVPMSNTARAQLQTQRTLVTHFPAVSSSLVAIKPSFTFGGIASYNRAGCDPV